MVDHDDQDVDGFAELRSRSWGTSRTISRSVSTTEGMAETTSEGRSEGRGEAWSEMRSRGQAFSYSYWGDPPDRVCRCCRHTHDCCTYDFYDVNTCLTTVLLQELAARIQTMQMLPKVNCVRLNRLRRELQTLAGRIA